MIRVVYDVQITISYIKLFLWSLLLIITYKLLTLFPHILYVAV